MGKIHVCFLTRETPDHYWPFRRPVVGLAPVLDKQKTACITFFHCSWRVSMILYVTIQYLWHLAFVADTFWSFLLEPPVYYFQYNSGLSNTPSGKKRGTSRANPVKRIHPISEERVHGPQSFFDYQKTTKRDVLSCFHPGQDIAVVRSFCSP